MDNKLNPIRPPWALGYYFNQPKVLSAILSKISELGLEFYVGQCGAPFVKWQGQWTDYKEVSMIDNRLEVPNLYK